METSQNLTLYILEVMEFIPKEREIDREREREIQFRINQILIRILFGIYSVEFILSKSK